MKRHDLFFFLITGLFLINLHTQARSLPTHQAENQAIRYYEQQLALAQQKGLSLSMEQSYHDLAEAYASRGDYKKAYEYERLHFAKHDSIVHTRKQQPSTALLTADISEDKRTQNHPWSFISTIIEMKSGLWTLLLLSGGLAILLLSFLLFRNYRRTNQINSLFHQQTEILVAQRDSIEEKSQKMEQLNITKDKFFSIVAHDLRGPINSLASFSNLLVNDFQRLSPQEIKVIAQELNKSVKNTSRLTENLLTWARLQMDNLNHYPSYIDLNKVVQETMALFQTTALQKQIHLHIDPQPGIKVYADESQLRFILRNLTGNAVKFTRPQGTVRIATALEQNQIKISVEDNGVGISPELVEKLFRIDAKHSTIGTAGEKGTGLGLVLCKEFVEKNGGQIELHSEPDKGSTFVIYLQAAKEIE